MTNRLGMVVLAPLLVCALALGTASCAAPYSGKPDRLRKMKKKKPPEKPADEGPAEVVWDDKCRVNLHDDKPPKRRRKRSSASIAKKADVMLVEAEDLDGERRILKVIDAINKLKSALSKDQFSTEAIYKMAVAYTLVRKKGCALMLLARLNDLQRMPEVARSAELTIERAHQDQTFEPFRKEADAAMGM